MKSPQVLYTCSHTLFIMTSTKKNQKKINKLIHITTNPLCIFMLCGGVVLGVLNQYPDFVLMASQGLIEGFVFYFVGVFISSVFYISS